MTKREHFFTKRVTRIVEAKHISWIGIIVLFGLLTVNYILNGYETKEETRKIHHLNDYRGLNSVSYDTHCRK